MIPKGTQIKLFNGSGINERWRGKIVELCEDSKVEDNVYVKVISPGVEGYPPGSVASYTIRENEEMIYQSNRQAIDSLKRD
jgi:hypothetical protein